MLNPQVLLSLARDNKWQELKAAVALGVPIMWSNPVSSPVLPCLPPPVQWSSL